MALTKAAKPLAPASPLLPRARQVAAFLRSAFLGQRQTILKKLGRGGVSFAEAFDLSRWDGPMAEHVTPELLLAFGVGWQATRDRIAQRRAGKRIDPFRLFNPRVIDYVRRLAFHFCHATNQTTTQSLLQAHASLRRQLERGLVQGDPQLQLTVRVRRIFNEPHRAWRIAATESSRAMHGGQMESARESGVVTQTEWLASADACDLCLVLNGKRVALGQPFTTTGAGPYGTITHPPAHPFCMCTAVEVIDF